MRLLNKNPHKSKYIHLRYYNEDGSVMNQGGITIAYRPSHEQPNKLEVAFSRCREFDNFNRKIGRTIADGHLKYYCFYYIDKIEDEAEEYNAVIEAVTKKIEERSELAEAVSESREATLQ